MVVLCSEKECLYKYPYSVKMINATKKSDYTLKKLEYVSKFATRNDLIATLSDTFEIKVNKVGYILPGHGLKGKNHYLLTDEDLSGMYELFKGKDIIVVLLVWY